MLGMGKKDRAEVVLGNCTLALILTATLLTTFFSLYGREVLLKFGASENTIIYAWSYLQIYCLGTLFVQLALGLNAFINAQGYTTIGMLTVLMGAVCNVVLDPIFIFVLGLGVRGAALATVISQGISSAWVVAFLTVGKSYLRIRLCCMKPDFHVLAPAVALGASPFTMQFTDSVLNVCFNTSLLKYGGDLAVGAMTIVGSVFNFVFLPLQGLTQGAQPITSFNYGPRKYDRVKRVFLLLLASTLVLAFIVWGLAEFVPWLPVSIFTREPELSALSIWALRIYLFAYPFMGLQVSCQQTFVALGNARTSLFVALLRKVFLLIPLIYILPNFFKDKVFAVFVAEPLSDFISATTAAILFVLFFKKFSVANVVLLRNDI